MGEAAPIKTQRIPRPWWAGDIEPALQQQFEAFVSCAERQGSLGQNMAWSASGLALSAALSAAAQNIGSSKATEFSADVFWAQWAAAVVAFLAAGGHCSQFVRLREGLATCYSGNPHWADRVAQLDQLVPIDPIGSN